MPRPSAPMPVGERKALTMRDAQAYAAISKNRLYGKIAAGEVRSMFLGNRRVVLREDLDRLLEPAS
jgi:hypothetical protein